MTDKDDILRKVIPASCHWEDNLCNTPKHYVHTAMDEHAKNIAIEFAEWVVKNHYRGVETSDEGVLYSIPGSHEVYATKELYNIFISAQQNKD